MSRYIQGAPRLDEGDELYQKDKKANKLLLLKNGDTLYGFLVRDNRIYKAAREEKEDFPIGTIVLGKVQHVAKQFQGAFFALKDKKDGGKTGFLQMGGHVSCQPVNREADGRLLCGDEMPVQIVKQAKGNKPPQLTLECSLAGQFAVVKKGSGRISYSAKIGREDRERIEESLDEWKSSAAETELLSHWDRWDITFRTNAPHVQPEIWRGEIVDLISQLRKVDRLSQTRAVYSRLYEPEAFYLDFIKDQPLSSVEEIVTDEKAVYEVLKAHAYTRFLPVRFYEDSRISLAGVYALDTRLRELLSPKVYLKSGAYLMIEQTEALVAVDVNSGKAEKKAESEEFYFKINLEAVKEICYQLSARNLSGIILVDFINMKDRRHAEVLIKALREETAKDQTPTRFIDLTKLGIAEITRKKDSRALADMLRDWAWKVQIDKRREDDETTGDQ